VPPLQRIVEVHCPHGRKSNLTKARQHRLDRADVHVNQCGQEADFHPQEKNSLESTLNR